MVKKPTYEELEQRVKELEAETQIWAHEARFRALYESDMIGIAYWKASGELFDANDKWLDIIGYTRKDMARGDADWSKITPPEFLHLDEKGIQQIKEQGYCDPFEKEYVRKDGSRVPILIGGAALGDIEKGGVTYMVDFSPIKETQKALEESEKKYRQLVELAQEGIWVIDKDSKTVFVNPSMAKMLGYSSDEMHGKHLFSFMDEKVIELAEKKLNRRKNGVKEQHDFEFIHKDGHPVFTTIETAPILDKEGHYNGAIAGVINITGRKKVEKELRMSQMNLSALIENTEGSIWSVDREYRLIVGNSAFQNNISSVRGQSFSPGDCVLADEFSTAIDDWRGYYDRALNGERFIIESKRQFLDKSRDMEYRFNPIQGIDGVVGGVTVFANDITERKQAEKELYESEKKYRTTAETMPGIVYKCNTDWTFTFTSDGIEDLTGYPASDFIDSKVRSYESIMNKEDTKVIIQTVGEAIGKKEPLYSIEYRIANKDGSTRWVYDSVRINYKEDGEVDYFEGVILDITDRKNLETLLQQSQKMDALGTLAGGIAHEFNNILGIIIGNAELGYDDVPDWNPAKSCLEEIKTASLRAKDVVRQILSFTRKTSGERKPIQITTIVKEVLKLIHATIPAGIQINQNILCDTEHVLGNPTEINQILLNLFSNASKAMPKEKGVIDVTLEPIALDEDSTAENTDLFTGDYIKLTVADDGTGIDPVIQDKVFDPYFTTKGVGEGTGMGLAIVYGLVKKHDGAITLTSEVGQGTTVEILLPVVEGKVEEASVETDSMPTGTERILFVDDEPSLADMVRQMLTQLGYDVMAQTSSQKALDLFKEEPDRFDLVITDMAMPEMAGDELAKKLINIRSDIPIILSSGHSERMDEDKAHQLGIQAYLMKPILKRNLSKTVRNVLDENQHEHTTGSVLLMDDEPQFRELFKRELTRNGFEVFTAADGKEGMNLYRQRHPDIVVVDLIMPEKEGIETIMDLKKEFSGVKIIAISGGGQGSPTTYLEMAKKMGAEKTFPKPIDWPDLIKTIKELLS